MQKPSGFQVKSTHPNQSLVAPLTNPWILADVYCKENSWREVTGDLFWVLLSTLVSGKWAIRLNQPLGETDSGFAQSRTVLYHGALAKAANWELFWVKLTLMTSMKL